LNAVNNEFECIGRDGKNFGQALKNAAEIGEFLMDGI
jgi:hypothetical protein